MEADRRIPTAGVAARHVIKLIAKITITIVEVDMEDELGQRDRPV